MTSLIIVMIYFYPQNVLSRIRRQWESEEHAHQVVRDAWNSERQEMVVERRTWQKEPADHILGREAIASAVEREQ